MTKKELKRYVELIEKGIDKYMEFHNFSDFEIVDYLDVDEAIEYDELSNMYIGG
jgi:hypothetical protein